MAEPLPRARRGRKPKHPHQVTNRVREFRDKNDLSQGALGDMIGMSGDTIGHIERGTRGLSMKRAKLIAKALNVGTQDLIPEASGVTVPVVLRIAAAFTDRTPDEFDIAAPDTRYTPLPDIEHPEFCFAAELVDDSYDRRFPVGTVFIARETAAMPRPLQIGDVVIVRHFATDRAAGDTFEVLAGLLARSLEGDLTLQTATSNRDISASITIQRAPLRHGLSFRAQAIYGDIDPDAPYQPGDEDEAEIVGVVEMVIAPI